MAVRGLLRLAGALLVGGMVLSFIATALHPATEDPNDHVKVFAEYARSDSWTAVHLGQFAAALVVIAGLVVLYLAMQAARPSVLARLALGSAVATAAAVAALQAVDGVALKQAVDSWASAPAAQKAAEFHDAEIVRWIEWGVNSYFRVLQGATVLLFSAAIVRTAIVPAWLGWLGTVVGAGYIALGVIVGYDGFSDAAVHVVGPLADLGFLIVGIGIMVAARRMKEPGAAGF